MKKNDFAKNVFRNLRMCELLANGIVKDFFYHVYTLQYLRNMEEQAKSFFRRWLFINRRQSHKIIPRRVAFELEPTIRKNCDVFTHSYDFFIVVMRNCAVVFRNYGSQCDRSYAITGSQFDRNETHGLWDWINGVLGIISKRSYRTRSRWISLRSLLQRLPIPSTW